MATPQYSAMPQETREAWLRALLAPELVERLLDRGDTFGIQGRAHLLEVWFLLGNCWT